MWILCNDGSAINTDWVARFRKRGTEIVADLPGLTINHTVGKTTTTDIIRNIISNQKIMEVNDYVD